MFRNEELEQLQRHKELLVLQSNATRLILAAQWQRLSAPDFWLGGAGNAAIRHPVWVAALGTSAGFLAIKLLRRPARAAGRLGRWGGAATTALSIWRIIRKLRLRS